MRYCQSSPQSSTSNTLKNLNENSDENSNQPPLVVLLTWLAAQEKHIEKYRSLYLKKGFDVMTVKTSPYELLFPGFGAKKIAQKCTQTLQKELSDYPKVLLHCFSVGAYMFGEMLMEMKKEQNQDEQKRLENRIKGVVFDSIVAFEFEGISDGVSRSITPNPILMNLLKLLIKTHMIVNYGVATKHYRAASESVWNNYLRVPALYLVSENDKIGTPHKNKEISEVWKKLGIDVTFKLWEKSDHVKHYINHQQEYEQLIDHFLKKTKIDQTNALAY